MSREEETVLPEWTTGLWKREYIQREGKEKEYGTVVRYLQAKEEFVDVRVGETEKDTMAFAGVSGWVESKKELRWHAAFNLDPPEADAKVWGEISAKTHTTEDFGRVEQLSTDHWMEYGSDYTEEWVRHPHEKTTDYLSAKKAGHFLLIANGFFGYVSTSTQPHTYCIGTASDLEVTHSASEAVKAGEKLQLSSEGWTISESSTIPFPS